MNGCSNAARRSYTFIVFAAMMHAPSNVKSAIALGYFTEGNFPFLSATYVPKCETITLYPIATGSVVWDLSFMNSPMVFINLVLFETTPSIIPIATAVATQKIDFTLSVCVSYSSFNAAFKPKSMALIAILRYLAPVIPAAPAISAAVSSSTIPAKILA
jgi:hypothetical protein